MFTGIIETVGTVREIEKENGNLHFIIESTISEALQVDQSVAHDGVCLTVTSVSGNRHTVTAVAETLQKTNLGSWRTGRPVNLERALQLGERLDGHMVQGHIDGTGTCICKEDREGSSVFRFTFPEKFAALVIEKGSICVNGVSLTAFDITNDAFSVTIIPYTFTHTSFGILDAGQIVNLEFDILGKYFLRQQSLEKERL